MKTVYADHCKGAFCLALTHEEGWKLAYSGDTQPSLKFVEIGKYCFSLTSFIYLPTIENFSIDFDVHYSILITPLASDR